MRSVTKSVVALAVLVAHSQGKIKSLDHPIFEFFPEHARYAQGEKKNITLRHVLTMTAGLEWDEQISYADPKNSDREMNDSANAIEYVLSRPLVKDPGTVFNYSGGMTQLLAAVIKRSTGMEVDQFTAKYLFSPLGISDHRWVRIVDGQPSAASGLRLRSRDMAKIGLMLMNNGRWNGKRIIPAKLVRDALKPHARAPFPVPGGHVDYGYQIWLPTQTVGGRKHSWAEFEGNGGQIVILDNTNGILVAVTAGNYNQRDIAKSSADIFLDIVLPAIKRR
jgi:CubicO group peptidase (beta-lactamase class C family)